MTDIPIVTLVGVMFVLFGCFWIAFTPKERIVQVTAPQYGTMIAVLNSSGTEASLAAVPYAEDNMVLAWDSSKKMYRWVPVSSASTN